MSFVKLSPLQQKKIEERRKKKEFDDLLINNYKSNFIKEDAALLNDPNWDVEYYIDEFSGQPVRNVFLKQQKENIDTLRKPQSQGYRYEILTPEEKEMAEILSTPLPEKLRRQLGVTIKAGRRIYKNKNKTTKRKSQKSKAHKSKAHKSKAHKSKSHHKRKAHKGKSHKRK